MTSPILQEAAARVLEIASEIDRYASEATYFDDDEDSEILQFTISEPLRESLREALAQVRSARSI
jgi:hypothetical protein